MAIAEAADNRGIAGRSVIVCAEKPDDRRLLASAVVAGGHDCLREVDSVGLFENGRPGAADCIVLAADRLSARTLETISLLGESHPEAKVVVACERASGSEVRRAIAGGVGGVVRLEALEEALAAAIAAVCSGQVCVPAEDRRAVGAVVLTTREKQILGLVVMGMSNAEIAAKLYLAESTVKSHLSSAFAKLGVASRSEAAAVILDPRAGAGLGILTIPTE